MSSLMTVPDAHCVLGIDVSFTASGYVVAKGGSVQYAGVIRTKPQAKKRGLRVADDNADRCQQIARELFGVLETWRPAGVVVELPSGGSKSAKAMRAMAYAVGVVCAVLEATQVPSEWVTPGMVKQAATGREDGPKEAVQAAVRRIFDWGDHWPAKKTDVEHVADAAATLLAARDGVMMRTLERVAAG